MKDVGKNWFLTVQMTLNNWVLLNKQNKLGYLDQTQTNFVCCTLNTVYFDGSTNPLLVFKWFGRSKSSSKNEDLLEVSSALTPEVSFKTLYQQLMLQVLSAKGVWNCWWNTHTYCWYNTKMNTLNFWFCSGYLANCKYSVLSNRQVWTVLGCESPFDGENWGWPILQVYSIQNISGGVHCVIVTIQFPVMLICSRRQEFEMSYLPSSRPKFKISALPK